MLTAGVWYGGNRDSDPGAAGGGPIIQWLQEHDKRLCELLRCLLFQGGTLTPELEKQLRDAGVNIARLRRCLDEYCRSSTQASLSATLEAAAVAGGTQPSQPSGPTSGCDG
jgi:hypothetical protein